MDKTTEALYTKIGKMLMDIELLVADRQNLLSQIETLNQRIEELESPKPLDLTSAGDQDGNA